MPTTKLPVSHKHTATQHPPLSTLSLFWLVLFVLGIGVVRMSSDARAEKVEDKWDRTASYTNKGQERAGPLVSQPIVHLSCEEDA
jgi:hypothetical protein